MKFFFCESCGKRISESDLAEGRGRDKQAKGVYCRECARGVMTLDFDDVPERRVGPRGTPAGSRAPVRGRSRSSGARLPATRAPTTGARLQAQRAGQRDAHRGNPSVRSPEGGSNQTLFFGLAGGALVAVLCAIFLGDKPVTPPGSVRSEQAGAPSVPKYGPKPPPNIPKLDEKADRPGVHSLTSAMSTRGDDFMAGSTGILPTGESLPHPPAPAVAKPVPAPTPAPKPPEIKPPAPKPEAPKPLKPATVEVQSPTAVAKIREAADQAFEALEAQLKTLGNDYDAKIAATEAFLNTYGETIPGARARSMLRDFKESRGAAKEIARSHPPPQQVVLVPPPKIDTDRPRLGDEWDAFKSIDDLKVYRGQCWWDGDRRLRIFYDFIEEAEHLDWFISGGKLKVLNGECLVEGAPGMVTWSLPMYVPHTKVYARGRFSQSSVMALGMALGGEFRWANLLRIIAGPKGSGVWGQNDAILQSGDKENPSGRPVTLFMDVTKSSIAWKEPFSALEGKVDCRPNNQAILIAAGSNAVAFEDVLIEQELDDFYMNALKARSEKFKSGGWTGGVTISFYSDDGKTPLAESQEVQAAIGGSDVHPPANLPDKFVARIKGNLFFPESGEYNLQLLLSGAKATLTIDGKEPEIVKDAEIQSNQAKPLPITAGLYPLDMEVHVTGRGPVTCRLIMRRPGRLDSAWELLPSILFMQPLPDPAQKKQPASE